MWESLRKDVDLEPETEPSHNVYLGCNQRTAIPDENLIREKNQFFRKLITNECTLAEGNLSETGGPKGASEVAGNRGSKKKKAQKHQCAAGNRSSKKPYPPMSLENTKAWNYDMIGHAEQCVQRWCELAKKEPKDLPCVGYSLY